MTCGNRAVGINRTAKCDCIIRGKSCILKFDRRKRIDSTAAAFRDIRTEERSRYAERSADIDRAAGTFRNVVFQRTAGNGQISRGVDRTPRTGCGIGQELIIDKRQIPGLGVDCAPDIV